MTTTIEGGERPTDMAGHGAPCDAPLPFQSLCRTARTLFQLPIAALVLEDGAGCWIDRREEIAAGEGLPELMLFAREARAGLTVEDLGAGESFTANPCVAGAPYLRFMARRPIGGAAPEGWLCVFDTEPRSFSDEEGRQLDELAAIAAACLRLYRDGRETAARESHYRLLAESSTDTLVRGGLDGVRLYVSPAVRQLLGYEPEELVGRRAQEITHPDDREEFRALMEQVRAGTLELGLSEQRQRHKNGSWVWLEASIRLTRDDVTGEPDGYVASVRDISRRKEAEAKLLHIARHDALTGLANRTLFRERLEMEISRARRSGEGFALFCLDVDRFKQVNDSFGHAAGDAMLRALAQHALAAVREHDLVARLGGDELALIQIGGDRASARALAERLIAAASRPLRFGGQEISAGLSIGIACSPEHGLDADQLVAAADQALYLAKSEGRGTYRFSPAPLSQAQRA